MFWSTREAAHFLGILKELLGIEVKKIIKKTTKNKIITIIKEI